MSLLQFVKLLHAHERLRALNAPARILGQPRLDPSCWPCMLLLFILGTSCSQSRTNSAFTTTSDDVLGTTDSCKLAWQAFIVIINPTNVVIGAIMRLHYYVSSCHSGYGTEHDTDNGRYCYSYCGLPDMTQQIFDY